MLIDSGFFDDTHSDIEDIRNSEKEIVTIDNMSDSGYSKISIEFEVSPEQII